MNPTEEIDDLNFVQWYLPSLISLKHQNKQTKPNKQMNDPVVAMEQPKVKALTLTFTRKKETKNKVVFEENTNQRPVIGSLYVDKWTVGSSTALEIVVNIK